MTSRTDEVEKREVMRSEDPFGIPACFYWTVDDVANWVESIGYLKYKEMFRTHSINGRKLLTVDACFLAKMGITNFADILALADAVHARRRSQDAAIACRYRCSGSDAADDGCLGHDLDTNWRYWVPEFHLGYMPKARPITAHDFDQRMKNHRTACNLMGRHHGNLVRPP